jgi:hypothetical protein
MYLFLSKPLVIFFLVVEGLGGEVLFFTFLPLLGVDWKALGLVVYEAFLFAVMALDEFVVEFKGEIAFDAIGAGVVFAGKFDKSYLVRF